MEAPTPSTPAADSTAETALVPNCEEGGGAANPEPSPPSGTSPPEPSEPPPPPVSEPADALEPPETRVPKEVAGDEEDDYSNVPPQNGRHYSLDNDEGTRKYLISQIRSKKVTDQYRAECLRSLGRMNGWGKNTKQGDLAQKSNKELMEEFKRDCLPILERFGSIKYVKRPGFRGPVSAQDLGKNQWGPCSYPNYKKEPAVAKA